MQNENKGINARQPVVLIADDDDLCLDVGVKMLQKLGYKVFGAQDGKEALEVFKNNQAVVDLVILDMKMPHHGAATFEKLKKLDANVKVLVISGFTEDELIKSMMAHGCDGYLQKPFSINTLLEKVTNALNK